MGGEEMIKARCPKQDRKQRLTPKGVLWPHRSTIAGTFPRSHTETCIHTHCTHTCRKEELKLAVVARTIIPAFLGGRGRLSQVRGQAGWHRKFYRSSWASKALPQTDKKLKCGVSGQLSGGALPLVSVCEALHCIPSTGGDFKCTRTGHSSMAKHLAGFKTIGSVPSISITWAIRNLWDDNFTVLCYS